MLKRHAVLHAIEKACSHLLSRVMHVENIPKYHNGNRRNPNPNLRSQQCIMLHPTIGTGFIMQRLTE